HTRSDRDWSSDVCSSDLTWRPRIARQIVVLNRADLLPAADADRVRDDLRSRLRLDALDDVPIALTRARDGASGIAELRGWLEQEIGRASCRERVGVAVVR